MNQLGLKSFDQILPTLVNLYNKRNLIPFTGSGLSAPNIPTWPGFLRNLCSITNVEFNNKINYTSQELIQLSDRLVTLLSRNSKKLLVASIRQSLGYTSDKVPLPTDSCIALSKIWWPLVLSTNYDRMFVEEYIKSHRDIDGPPVSVFGRNQSDCHSLLSSLESPSNTIYWALQGYFGNGFNGEDLQEELVVGYKQYRSATFNNPAFRSAFAEIFRNYSFLFIGSSLNEEYFRGLFGEIIERHGSNPMPHFALFRKEDIDTGSIDHHLMHTRFNIISVYYENETGSYAGLCNVIRKLNDSIKSETHRLWKFAFKPRKLQVSDERQPEPGLELLASSIVFPRKNECVVFSAGREHSILLSHIGINLIIENLGSYDEGKFEKIQGGLWRYSDSDIFAAVARREDNGKSSRDNRDLRIVCDAMIDILKYCNGHYKEINVMLLAAGRRRVFPPVYSLIQMVRGYKGFVSNNEVLSKIKIHIVDPAVLSFLRKYPLEIEELLNSDEIRLNVQIQDDNETERFQFFAAPGIAVSEISVYCDISETFWNVRFLPSPFPDQKINVNSTLTVREAGLIPGSTIIYTRKGKPEVRV